MLYVKADTKSTYYSKNNIDEPLDHMVKNYIITGEAYGESEEPSGIEATQSRILNFLGELTAKLKEKNLLSDQEIFDLIGISSYYVGIHNFRIEDKE